MLFKLNGLYSNYDYDTMNRYRGYYYDTETGYYYLQSRYYNPTVGRFLNADVYCDTGTNMLGTNMFAYCDNNPMHYSDSSGTFAAEAIGGAALGKAISEIIAGMVIAVGTILWICAIGLIIQVVSNAITNCGSSEMDYSESVSAQTRKANSQEYKFCYMNSYGSMTFVGSWLTWAQTLAVLGILDTTLDYNVIRDINPNNYGSSAKTCIDQNKSCWGIYASSQVAAKTLAVSLGNFEGARYIMGGYPHYHDGKHRIHIWFGLPQ